MDYLGWVGIGVTFAVQIATLAYQWSQLSGKIDKLESDVDEINEELKEYRPLKGDLNTMKEVLIRLELRLNQLFDLKLAEIGKRKDDH